MKIVLAGCTGFIGEALMQNLWAEGHDLIVLTRSLDRNKDREKERFHFLKWDSASLGDWGAEVDGADAVINLTGEAIAGKRWTEDQKKKIIESRVLSTRAMVDAILQSQQKPSVFINASAVGFYGNVVSGEVNEKTFAGSNFLADTCIKWEEETRRAEEAGVRTIQLRIGIVLEKGGGALAKMIPPFLFFIGGPLGNGKQWMPWIHRDDIVSIIQFILRNEEIVGAVNATAPYPVTMKEFCQKLGSALNRPSWAPVPAFALKLLLGEMADMLLGGQKAVPEKILQAGYVFKFPTLTEAFQEIL